MWKPGAGVSGSLGHVAGRRGHHHTPDPRLPAWCEAGTHDTQVSWPVYPMVAVGAQTINMNGRGQSLW